MDGEQEKGADRRSCEFKGGSVFAGCEMGRSSLLVSLLDIYIYTAPYIHYRPKVPREVTDSACSLPLLQCCIA